MADAKKCDRCGEYYQKVELTAIENLANSLRQSSMTSRVFEQLSVIEKFLDLCPSCSKSLRQWVKCEEDREDGK